MTEFLTAEVPLWAVVAAAVLSLAAGRLFRRAALVEARQQAERVARYATGRQAVREEAAAEAVTRALDLDRAHDVYGTDDLGEPPSEPGDERVDPPPAEVVPVRYGAAVLPRYDWSRAVPWPADRGVMPDRWSMFRWRMGRWSWRPRAAVVYVAGYVRARWDAAQWDTSAGWAPGELAAVDTVELFPGALHRADGQATGGDYAPQHGFDEVPPSIAVPLGLMTPGERARELVRQLGQRDWWPWADVADHRVRLRVRAQAIARRHGRLPLLGTFRLVGILP